MGNSVLDGGQECGLRVSSPEEAESDDSGLKISAVWDIETSDWDRFVCGSLWREHGGIEIFHSEDDFAETMLELPKGSQVWAHSGGRFDVLWLLDWCHRHKRIPPARVTLSGSTIACCAITGGPILRDSARVIPMSLKKASTMFGEGQTKQTLGLPCVCGKQCGGYCSISPNMPRAMRNRLNEYLVADIESLRDTLHGLFEYCGNNSIDLAGTLAGATWRTAKRWCGLEDAVWSYPQYKFVREGYKGGRCEGAVSEAEDIWRYDRTQAYPAAMTRPLPVGPLSAHNGKLAMRDYLKDRPGFYEARVMVPEMHACPLPLRHGNHLTYPHGVINGIWPREELKWAEEVGCKIEMISKSVAWSSEAPILKSYMEHCFKLREAAQTEALRTWVKLLANSLSGAFAQSPESDDVKFGDYADDPRYEQVGRYDWIWRRDMFRIPDRGHIHYAGTLTGDARVELGREIHHADDSWCYSDTDSVYAARELTRNVGKGLGLWKFEGKGREFVCVAPKVYSYLDEVSDKRHARAKGMADATKHWDDIVNRRPVKLEGGVESLLTAAKKDKLFIKRQSMRQLGPQTEWLGARLRDGVKTRAPHVTDLVRLP